MGGGGRAALVADSRRRVMDLMTRVWLKRLFWSLLALAATWVLVGR